LILRNYRDYDETAGTYKARLEMGNLGRKQEAGSAIGRATYVPGKAGMAG